MSGIIGTNLITQVGFIVKDIEKSKRVFAEFFGIEVPNHFDGGKFEITGTTVEGEPAPDANCLMAFFDVGDRIQIELIQPNGVKSTWQDFLDEHGEGIHHIALFGNTINRHFNFTYQWIDGGFTQDINEMVKRMIRKVEQQISFF